MKVTNITPRQIILPIIPQCIVLYYNSSDSNNTNTILIKQGDEKTVYPYYKASATGHSGDIIAKQLGLSTPAYVYKLKNNILNVIYGYRITENCSGTYYIVEKGFTYSDSFTKLSGATFDFNKSGQQYYYIAW